MSATYQVRIKNTAGVLQAVLTDFESLAYTKRVNMPDVASWRLKGDHDSISLHTHRGQVEVWRRYQDEEHDIDIDWYADFKGLYLDHEYQYQDRDVFTARAYGTNWLLATRWIAWYASTTNRTKFTAQPAETILKTLVDYNAGPNATVGNSRLREGAITGLSIEVDGAGGNSLDWTCPWQNLLTNLQSLTRVAGGDFDLVRTGATTVEFRWYLGQLGTDRSATVIFALERGNMANPRYRYNRADEKTAVIVAGQGDLDDRATVVRTSADYSASNDVEGFKDARNWDSTSGLNSAGDQYLDEKRAAQELIFDVLQTPASLYGSHYFLGDLVTARYHTTLTQKIVGVTVDFSNGQERISLELETQ